MREIVPVAWRGDEVAILDQRVLPHREVTLACRTVEDVCEAIRTLAVRGAPIIGVAAAYGLALAATISPARDEDGLRADLSAAAEALVATRPTAVNLGWAVARALRAADRAAGAPDSSPDAIRDAVLAEARAIEEEDRAACDAIGRNGLPLVPQDARILTHCNTGIPRGSGRRSGS
jgi:methylthioribose-1-phosphate isomerase